MLLLLIAENCIFNSPNKVFEFDTKTNTAKEIYEYTEIPDISKTYLFGLAVKDGNLCAEYTTNLMNGVESFITIITAPKPTETPIVTETTDRHSITCSYRNT